MPGSGDIPGGWHTVRDEALALIGAATDRGVVLRLVGSVGIRLYSPAMERLMQGLRDTPKDLDFVCRKQDRNALRALLEGRGYENDRHMLVAMEGHRYLFVHRESGLKLDVFVDRLDFCHRIDLRGRLELHPVTIALEPLILHKLQIVELTEGDFLDIGIMLASVSPGEGGDENTYSMDRLLAPLADNWGFWKTATGNLERVRERTRTGRYMSLDEEAAARIASHTDTLLEAARAAPKSISWKLRARVGERLQWWQDVDDRVETY